MFKHRPEDSRTVYSTESGRMCPVCGKAVDDCVCKQRRAAPKGDGVVRVRLESKGRKGKSVTVISGLALNEDGLKSLLSELKRQCGSGGTVKDGTLEIQGDHRDTLITALKKQGINAKRAGG